MNYDAGRPTVDGGYTRPTLPDDLVAREVAVIANHLHCNAIRITGDSVSRIATVAQYAAGHGMVVWLSPSLGNATPEQHLNQLEQVAVIAHELRGENAQAVVVAGCELSVFTKGIIQGASVRERMALLADPNYWTAPGAAEAGADAMHRFEAHLASGEGRALIVLRANNLCGCTLGTG